MIPKIENTYWVHSDRRTGQKYMFFVKERNRDVMMLTIQENKGKPRYKRGLHWIHYTIFMCNYYQRINTLSSMHPALHELIKARVLRMHAVSKRLFQYYLEEIKAEFIV